MAVGCVGTLTTVVGNVGVDIDDFGVGTTVVVDGVLEIEAVVGELKDGDGDGDVSQSGVIDIDDTWECGTAKGAEDPAGLIMLEVLAIGKAEGTVSMVVVTATVCAGSVISIVSVITGRGFGGSETVDMTVSSVGVRVLPGAVMVFVISWVCTTVVRAAPAPDDELAAESELPSTATTE